MPDVTGPVRARDLRANIAEMGFERGVTATLELMLEEHSHMRYQLHQMAQLLDSCMDQIINMVSVGKTMTEKMNELKRADLGNGHDS